MFGGERGRVWGGGGGGGSQNDSGGTIYATETGILVPSFPAPAEIGGGVVIHVFIPLSLKTWIKLLKCVVGPQYSLVVVQITNLCRSSRFDHKNQGPV